jgi:DNA polymerase III subunit delta'
MSIVPLFGHETLRKRLREGADEGRLPASLLFHGARGIGKQRLALWLGQLLLCAREDARPCGACQHCRYSSVLMHPDLHWYFPRPRLKDADPSPETVREDYGDAIGERVERRGLYPPPDGSEGIFVATVRTLLQEAALSPALARRKVFVIGDADRMVAQEGADEAANAFLKLLEEPLADTTLILTSSEPGALLPTVRSRVVAMRVSALPERTVRQFLADPVVAEALAESDVPASVEERLQLAQGAPGALMAATGLREALNQAERLLAAALAGDPAERFRFAFGQGSRGARGSFAQMLDALTVLLSQRVRAAVREGDPRAAGTAKALAAVERAKIMATGNANPQLVSAALMRQLGSLVR